jgi:hypothetical protein
VLKESNAIHTVAYQSSSGSRQLYEGSEQAPCHASGGLSLCSSAQTQTRSLGNLCGIFSEHCVSGTGFSPITSVFSYALSVNCDLRILKGVQLRPQLHRDNKKKVEKTKYGWEKSAPLRLLYFVPSTGTQTS